MFPAGPERPRSRQVARGIEELCTEPHADADCEPRAEVFPKNDFEWKEKGTRVHIQRETHAFSARGCPCAECTAPNTSCTNYRARACAYVCVCKCWICGGGDGVGKTLRLTTLCIHLGSCAERQMHLCVCDICVCTVALHGN